MLILDRAQGEDIILDLPDGKQIKVTLLPQNKGSKKQRIGIEADNDVKIYRNEVYYKYHRKHA